MDVFFLIPGAAGRDVVERHGFKTSSTMKPTDIFLIDSYRFDARRLKAWRSFYCLAGFMDDENTQPPAYDVLIQTSAPEGKANPRFIRGNTYTPLRSDYWRRASLQIRSAIKTIFISLGGAPDPTYLRRIIHAAAQALPEARLLVASSGLPARHFRGILQRITFLGPRPSLRPFMLKSDAAISAAGQTFLELLSIGIPTIALELAPNQHANMSLAAKMGAAIALHGYPRESRMETRIGQTLSGMLQPKAFRSTLSRRARRLIDGRGALRLIDALRERLPTFSDSRAMAAAL